MTDELKQRVARLRAIAPRLNIATDQASRLVASVERLLVDELHIGLTARCNFNQQDNGIDDKGNRIRVMRDLAFGRLGGSFRIHVLVESGTLDADGLWSQTTDKTLVAWPSCDRETKLRAFEKLPTLLDHIINEAERLTQLADDTAAKIRIEEMASVNEPDEWELTGDRTYSTRDAANARRQFHLDDGLPEAMIEPWPLTGWTDDGGDCFSYHKEANPNKPAICTVQFLDEEGNADVSFANGDHGAVNIWEDQS